MQHPAAPCAVCFRVLGFRFLWGLRSAPCACCSAREQGQGGGPYRNPAGLNRNRLAIILAVLGKHTPIKAHTVDIHTNVVGGLTMSEPATDLAVALAIASSYCEQPIPHDVAAVGEIGLAGELRWAVLSICPVASQSVCRPTRLIVWPASQSLACLAVCFSVRMSACLSTGRPVSSGG
jgi:hypothetical protein